MEYASLAEKILRTIESIIKNNPYIRDFIIIPVHANPENKSPVKYRNYHLGLESWCVKYTYEYICSQLLTSPRNSRKKISSNESDSVEYLITGGLLINPDITTFWNMRRELVEMNVLQWRDEISFSRLVLTRKSKANEAFSYRRWLINRIVDKSKPNLVLPNHLLENELSICTQTAVSASNNYHSWTHRNWCLLNLACFCPQIIQVELDFSEQWVKQHVSENSGYHYRLILIDYIKKVSSKVPKQYLLEVINELDIPIESQFEELIVFLLGPFNHNNSSNDLTNYVNYITLLLYELIIVISYIDKNFDDHEALWLHRRNIIYRLLEISYSYLGDTVNFRKNICEVETLKNSMPDSQSNIMVCISSENNGEKEPKIFKCQPTKFESTNLCRILTDIERKCISINSLRSSLQCEYAKRHEKWLKYLVGFDINNYRILN